jgi:hypothetical protein
MAQPFNGFPEFLTAAAVEIGHPEAAIAARRSAALSGMAVLCAQAMSADDAHVEGILAKAAEFRDQLHAAYRASERMLSYVREARGLETSSAVVSVERSSAAAARRPAADRPSARGRS